MGNESSSNPSRHLVKSAIPRVRKEWVVSLFSMLPSGRSQSTSKMYSGVVSVVNWFDGYTGRMPNEVHVLCAPWMSKFARPSRGDV